MRGQRVSGSSQIPTAMQAARFSFFGSAPITIVASLNSQRENPLKETPFFPREMILTDSREQQKIYRHVWEGVQVKILNSGVSYSV